MLGGHLLAASATTQNVVATSSGEAEFYALTKSAVAVAMAADMAKIIKPHVRVDATASKAIASRRGVGQVRHLHTQVLWVQEAVARRDSKIPPTWGRNTWEESRMPYHWRNRFRTSIEIDKRSMTSVHFETNGQPEFKSTQRRTNSCPEDREGFTQHSSLADSDAVTRL